MSPRSANTSPAAEEEESTAAASAQPSKTASPSATAKPRAAGGARSKKSSSRKPPSILLPVLVVDETLLLPHMSIPFPVEDEETARVVERASRSDNRFVLVLTERPIPPELSTLSPNGSADEGELRALLADAISEAIQSDGEGEPEWIPDPEPEPQEYELCGVGVIAEIAQFRLSGSRHVVLQGLARGIVTELVQQDPYLVARVVRQDDPVDSTAAAEAAMTAVMEQVENYISMLPNVPEEVLTMVRGVEEPGWLADLIAFSPEFTTEQRQTLLEVRDPIDRLRQLSVMIQKRLIVMNLRQEIATEAQAGMDRQQREYFLREQLRAIQKELGESGSEAAVARELREKIEAAGMPEETKN